MSDSSNPIDKSSLAEQVAERLRNEIISGRFTPGSRLNLDKYKSIWNISITPLRDAAKRLEADGLVHISPRRGIFVAEINNAALVEVFQIRIALEPLVTELAAPHAPGEEIEGILHTYQAASLLAKEGAHKEQLLESDRLIHDFVLEHCPNKRLARIMTSLRDSIVWCRNTVVEEVPDAFIPSIEEHIAICLALRDKDGIRAAAAMREHLISTFDRTMTALSVNSLSK